MLQLIARGTHEFEVLPCSAANFFMVLEEGFFILRILSLGDFLYPLLGSFAAEVHIV